jgi:hypothetical protein
VGDALDDLLALVDLCNLLFQELVAALADLDDLSALDTPSCARLARARRAFSETMLTCDRLEDLLGNLSGSLVLGEGVGIGQAVV